MGNVFLLRLENHGRVADNDVDIEQIRDRPFVFHVPARCKRVNELGIERVGAIVGVKDEKVIHIASKSETLPFAVDNFGHRKDTRIRFALSEFEIHKPWKERALPSSPSLSHAINWFVDPKYAWFVVRANRCVPGRRVTVTDLVLL
eukprot:6213511-Pleurochrysis_carterae.AAC.2